MRIVDKFATTCISRVSNRRAFTPLVRSATGSAVLSLVWLLPIAPALVLGAAYRWGNVIGAIVFSGLAAMALALYAFDYADVPLVPGLLCVLTCGLALLAGAP